MELVWNWYGIMKINDMGGAMVKFTGPPCTTGEKRKRGLQPWSEANRVELL